MESKHITLKYSECLLISFDLPCHCLRLCWVAELETVEISSMSPLSLLPCPVQLSYCIDPKTAGQHRSLFWVTSCV